MDAVVKPFVHMHNKRAHTKVEAGQLVEMRLDGAQVAAIGAGDQGKALSYLERAVAAARIAYGRDAPEVAHVQQMVEMMEPTRDA